MAEEMNEISGQQAADRVAKVRMEKSRAEILCAMDCLVHHPCLDFMGWPTELEEYVFISKED